MTIQKPCSLFPLPSAPIDKGARKSYASSAVAEVSSALNAYYMTMPPYEPPPVYHNPRA